MPQTYRITTDQGVYNVTVDDGPKSDTKPVAANEPDTRFGGIVKSLKDQFAKAAGPMPTKDELPFAHVSSPATQQMMNTPIVHPTGVQAIDGLTSPAGLSMMALGGLSRIGDTPINRSTVSNGLQAVGDLNLTKPLKVLGKIGQSIEPSPDTPPPGVERYGRPSAGGQAPVANPTSSPRIAYTSPPPTAPVEATAAGPAASVSGPLSDLELARQEVAAGRLPQSALSAIERAQASPKTPPGMIREPAPANAPLQQPRVDVGAETVGRKAGLTKQQVRDQTAPILGEAPGEASPILPEKALGRIVDTLKSMPPGSPEREAYVARATSGKSQWQIENIRRTLEHLGLIAPFAAATMRKTLVQGITGPNAQE